MDDWDGIVLAWILGVSVKMAAGVLAFVGFCDIARGPAVLFIKYYMANIDQLHGRHR